MDTYDLNETAFDWDLYQYQKYFDISRIGFGLFPVQSLSTAAFARRQVRAIERYSGSWISTWVIGARRDPSVRASERAC